MPIFTELTVTPGEGPVSCAVSGDDPLVPALSPWLLVDLHPTANMATTAAAAATYLRMISPSMVLRSPTRAAVAGRRRRWRAPGCTRPGAVPSCAVGNAFQSNTLSYRRPVRR